MKDIIRGLSEAYGPSGSEAGVRELITQEIKAAAGKTQGTGDRTDAMGNLIARVREPGQARDACGAHGRDRDRWPLTSRRRDSSGSPARACVPSPSSAAASVSRTEPSAPSASSAWKSLKGSRLGQVLRRRRRKRQGRLPREGRDSACFFRGFHDDGDRIVARPDDRIGCAILLRVLAELEGSPHDVSFVFTVQEEIGCRAQRRRIRRGSRDRPGSGRDGNGRHP